MKINGKVIVASFAILLITLLVACQSQNEDGADPNQNESDNNDSVSASDVEDENTENDVEELDDVNETQSNETEKDQSESNNAELDNDIQISSGDEAVHFLKEQLEEGKNEDISFGTDDELLTDDKGSFYMVQLVDVPLRASGKTGNLGYYKVYEDGTYEIFQAELSENIQLSKEDYVNKLDELAEEVEQYRKNSEATTTLEIEKDEVYILELWDQELNVIYGILQEQLSQDEMEQLREEQRDWINIRDETAEEAAKKYEGDSMESLEYTVTLANVTKERCYELVENYMK